MSLCARRVDSACAQSVVFKRVRVPLSWRDALKTKFDLRVRAVHPRGLQRGAGAYRDN